MDGIARERERLTTTRTFRTRCCRELDARFEIVRRRIDVHGERRDDERFASAVAEGTEATHE